MEEYNKESERLTPRATGNQESLDDYERGYASGWEACDNEAKISAPEQGAAGLSQEDYDNLVRDAMSWRHQMMKEQDAAEWHWDMCSGILDGNNRYVGSYGKQLCDAHNASIAKEEAEWGRVLRNWSRTNQSIVDSIRKLREQLAKIGGEQ